jgi:hypothetical protein
MQIQRLAVLNLKLLLNSHKRSRAKHAKAEESSERKALLSTRNNSFCKKYYNDGDERVGEQKWRQA